MRYDMKCAACGWEGEVTCRAELRHEQTCPNEVDVDLALTVKGDANGTVPGRATCGAPLEVLIGATALSREGFGFKPAIREDGVRYQPSKRRPATVQRGR